MKRNLNSDFYEWYNPNNPSINLFNRPKWNNRWDREYPGIDKYNKQSKLCRGELCNCVLPIARFAPNPNMVDGRDLYCIDCNIRKRQEKADRRNDKGYDKSIIYDPFEELAFSKYTYKQNPMIVVDNLANKRHSMILKTIDSTLQETKMRYKKSIKLKKQEIYERLFTGKFHCLRENNVLTPECFINHHTLTFVIDNNDLDIIPSECISATALEQQGFINIEAIIPEIMNSRQNESWTIEESKQLNMTQI